MRYLRVYLGASREEPGITLYEVDPNGAVHRMVEIQAHGARFAPEDILMLGTVDPQTMVQHPAAEAFDPSGFESLWREVCAERGFLSKVPDPGLPWEGSIAGPGGSICARWLPDGASEPGWTGVRGFEHLFVRGGAHEAERAYRAVFLDRSVRWELLAHAA